VLKNVLDYAYMEFIRKPIAFVDYGGVGAATAVEQLRLVAIELQMAPVSRAVHIGMVESLGIMQQGKTFEDFPHWRRRPQAARRHVMVGQDAEAGTRTSDDRCRRPRAERKSRCRHSVNEHHVYALPRE